MTRTILLQNNGVQFYLEQLEDPKSAFHTDAMEAIAVWYLFM